MLSLCVNLQSVIRKNCIYFKKIPSTWLNKSWTVWNDNRNVSYNDCIVSTYYQWWVTILGLKSLYLLFKLSLLFTLWWVQHFCCFINSLCSYERWMSLSLNQDMINLVDSINACFLHLPKFWQLLYTFRSSSISYEKFSPCALYMQQNTSHRIMLQMVKFQIFFIAYSLEDYSSNLFQQYSSKIRNISSHCFGRYCNRKIKEA